MKKLLTVLAAIGLTATTGVSVVACGKEPSLTPEKIDLTSVLTTTEIKAQTEEVVVQTVIEANKSSGVKADDIQVQKDTFKDPAVSESGSVIIEAKNQEMYTGTVEFKITALNKIDVKEKSVDVKVSETVEVEVLNAKDLDGLTAWSDKQEFVQAEIKKEVDKAVVVITGIAAGSATITVSADYAQPITFIANVASLKTIDVAQSLEMYLDETKTLEIKNADQLDGLTAVSDNEKIATAKITEGKVQIEGHNTSLKESETIQVKVSANHAADVTITVTVKALQIKLDPEVKDKISLSTTEVYFMTIANFEGLGKSVALENSDPQTVSVSEINEEGHFTIKGAVKGSTKITLTAKHAFKKEIAVQVYDQIEAIQVENKTVMMIEGHSVPININNYADLKNVTAQASNPDVVAIDIVNVAGKWKLKIEALKLGAKLNDCKVTLSADNADDVMISVVILGGQWNYEKEFLDTIEAIKATSPNTESRRSAWAAYFKSRQDVFMKFTYAFPLQISQEDLDKGAETWKKLIRAFVMEKFTDIIRCEYAIYGLSPDQIDFDQAKTEWNIKGNIWDAGGSFKAIEGGATIKWPPGTTDPDTGKPIEDLTTDFVSGTIVYKVV